VQPFVTAAAASIDNADTLAARFGQHCLQNYTTNNVVLCNDIQKTIRLSLAGSAAKRAGVLCSRLGSCSAADRCNVTAARGGNGTVLNSTLSMCAVEGVVGGTMFTPEATGAL
jgi:hypothetical protein